MLRLLGPFIVSVLIIIILSLINILLLKYLNKIWWQRKLIRKIAWLLPVAGVIAASIWGTSYITKTIWLSDIGAILTVIVLITLLALIISLPFSGIINSLNRWSLKRSERKNQENLPGFSSDRRKLITAGAALFPIAALSAGGAGISGGSDPARVYLRKIQFANLPPQLEGLRIFHMSDAHLGIYRTLEDIENLMAEAESFKPDMTLFTGDTSDKLEILPDMLKIISSMKSRFGAFGSLGNHEYYRGLPEVLSAYDKSDVVLFRSSGFSFNIGGRTLYLAGSDDPVRMGINVNPFLEKSITAALDGAPSDAFYILMSHRPEALDIAARKGINLTLAGHTHGGQVGIGGHSFWQIFAHDRYLWGEYAIGDKKMYLSSGIGHWLPFRLGCPPEAPVIELTAKS